MAEHSGRSFSEEQVRAIISGAIRRQEAARKVADTDGLTLEEIRRLAAEVGIDPKYVVAAASELEEAGEETSAARLLGGPLKVSYERFVEGRLSEEAIAAMVREIRSTLRQYRGNLEVLGASFDWVSPQNSGEDLLIQAQSENGHTRIYISQKFGTWAFLSFYLLTIPLGLSILFASMAPSPLAFALLAGFTALLFAGRFAFGMIVRKRSEKLRKLADRLEALAAEHAVSSEAASSEAASSEVASSEAASSEAASSEAASSEAASSEAAPARSAEPSPPLLDLSEAPGPEDEGLPPRRRRDASGRRD